MRDALTRFLDWFSNFFSQRKGLLPLLGILLVTANLVIRLTSNGMLAQTDLLLHLGVILGIFGILLAWAL
jgi:type II secretory pathway component PulF